MPKTPPFHAWAFGYSKADTEVHHDRDDCSRAKRILSHHRLEGEGGWARCEECARLEAASQTESAPPPPKTK